MKNHLLGNKVHHNAAKVKKDMSIKIGDGVSQFKEGIEKISSDARESVVGNVKTMKKNVGHGLSQSNSKAQDFAQKIPDSLGAKAAKNPWVAVTISLGIGILLGLIFKRRPEPC